MQNPRGLIPHFPLCPSRKALWEALRVSGGQNKPQRITHSFLQDVDVGVVLGSVPQDLLEEQRVFHQAAPRDVQEAPKVQLAAEGRLQAALQEILHPPVLLLLVQQGFGCQLVAAVAFVGVELR